MYCECLQRVLPVFCVLKSSRNQRKYWTNGNEAVFDALTGFLVETQFIRAQFIKFARVSSNFNYIYQISLNSLKKIFKFKPSKLIEKT